MFAAIASLNPFPRSRAEAAPGCPWISTTLPLFPIDSAIKSPANFDPSTLSEAMCVNTSPSFAPRSTVITGIFSLFAAAILVATASESTGLMMIKLTFFLQMYAMMN